MAVWSNPTTRKTFDDGRTAAPGEDGFEPQPGMNYCGTPNWVPPVEPEPLPEETESDTTNIIVDNPSA